MLVGFPRRRTQINRQCNDFWGDLSLLQRLTIEEVYFFVSYSLTHEGRCDIPAPKEEKQIADKFVAETSVNAVWCEACRDWFVQCPHCTSVICCYHKMCCYASFKVFQPKLEDLMESFRKSQNE